eukprot:CAMPEP_0202083578 /NCGR_PEP_ID=MMETSP0964-20121228/24458_1 /ASSEMBLY_ACC=CAM_ASM_000500 /TAXON_ID=4773 /ORGANISM="Schizochytrium aggregatum, Strain ATCC28209" /LENGTH=803 /DNA_ID=CAMNT_0048651299 /DNA_START=1 /DNA_END=2412 /DNA_ORIENTATION=-
MSSLTLLQNKIKRNPTPHAPEFRQQLRSFDAQLSIFELSPPKDSRDFGQLVTFLAHVAHLYPNDSGHFPEAVLNLLDRSYESMDPDLRRTLFQALILLRNRGSIDPVTLITVSFSLFRCKDKALRELLYIHIISDVRRVNRKASNLRLNKSIQNVVYRMLEDPNSIAAKKSLQVMVELYKRRVWIDSRTVNVIAGACLSNQPKNVAIALQFFLGIDEKIDALQDDEEDAVVDEGLEAATGKSLDKLERAAQKDSRIYAKKTRARMRKIAKEGKLLKKARQAKQSELRRANTPRFPAIEMLNDPQGFSEKLFRKLRSSNDHFEVRLMMMNLVSRVVGYHKLLLLPFYSFVQKYVQPYQRHVTAILAFLIQGAHDLVPAEDLEPILKHIANNFVTDRSGAEVMAVGLNSIRELINKVPLLTACQGMDDLIQDLILYKRFRRDKSVVIAARSLLNLVRDINPEVLQRKERGKFHSSEKLREYGASAAAEGVDGAELLQILEEEAAAMAGDDDESGSEEDDEGGKDEAEDGEVDEEEGEEMEAESGAEDEDDDDDNEEDDGEGDEGESDEDGGEAAEDGKEAGEEKNALSRDETLLEKSKKRKIKQTDRIDAKRLLTEEDFARIRKLKAKLVKEKHDPRARRKNAKNKEKSARVQNALLARLQKQGFEVNTNGEDAEAESSDDDPFASDLSSDSSEDEGPDMNGAAVDPGSLEGVIRKRRKELADRLASVHEGRRGAHELNTKRTGGTSNLEKSKNKPYLMVSKSRQVKQKQNVSLRQQQMQLKKHMKNLEKSKKTVQKVRRRSKKA